MRGSSKLHTFSDDDIAEYKSAWSQPGAITSMINWYRAMMRYRPKMPRGLRVHVPTIMLWGKMDVALSHRMAQPSIDFCDDGKLIFLENASHWVQHDESEAVTNHLLTHIEQE